MNNIGLVIFCSIGFITFLGMLFILLDIIYDDPKKKVNIISQKEMKDFEEEAASVYFENDESDSNQQIENNIHSFENDIVIGDSLVVLSGVITDDQTSNTSSIIKS